jgi:hypothetical protein
LGLNGEPSSIPSGTGASRDAPTALAVPGIAFHTCHNWLDRRDLDLVMPAVQLLILIAEFVSAMATAFSLGDNRFIRIPCQRSAAAFSAYAVLPLTGSFGPALGIGFLSGASVRARN